jgi:purine-binding chemotaxis protein CheW
MEIDSKTQINSYLTFKIGVEEFGIQVNKVLNILELQEITNVPKSPEYMKGVINLRGTILPIIDTRVKFEMTPTEFTDDTCIVVMDLEVEDEIIHVGALVDSVVAVREIDESQINPSPNIGKSYKSEFISGLVKIDESFVMILDVIKLFTGEDLKDLN